MNESWFKSKLIKFVIGYWIVVIVLVYSFEWIGRHQAAIGMAVLVILSAMGLWVALRMLAWWRNSRYW